MAATHSPPRAPPPEPYHTSYNSYGPRASPTSSAASTSPGAPPPRLSHHPFFVDQTPYISNRRLSSMSIQSTSSASTRTYRSASGSSTCSASSSASASTVSLAPAWPFRGKHLPSLAPAALISSSPTKRVRHTRAASTGHTNSSPEAQFSPRAASLHTPSAPIDRRCLQWMREAEQHDMILGSVASRSSPRGMRREPLADLIDAEVPASPAGAVEVLYEDEPDDMLPPRPGSRCTALKRRFRLNSA